MLSCAVCVNCVALISESLASNIAMSAAVRWVCSCRPVAAVVRSSTVARPAKPKHGTSATETSVSVHQVGTKSQPSFNTPTQSTLLSELDFALGFQYKTYFEQDACKLGKTIIFKEKKIHY